MTPTTRQRRALRNLDTAIVKCATAPKFLARQEDMPCEACLRVQIWDRFPYLADERVDFFRVKSEILERKKAGQSPDEIRVALMADAHAATGQASP